MRRITATKAAWRCLVILTSLAVPVAPGSSLCAAAEKGELEIALDLATMLRSARSVIAENQERINDASRGEKGLSGKVVLAKALEKFRKSKGHAQTGIDTFDTTTRHGRLLKAQMAAIETVMRENQVTIDQEGVGFKGFVPAVFARLVNEEFRRLIGQQAEVKVTAPPELVRNRKALPDTWETEVIRYKLSAPDWTIGRLFAAEAQNRGRDAFRVLVPEYYSQGCLACHGEPKGELDVTGYPKEGRQLGDLGGVISVTLYRR